MSSDQVFFEILRKNGSGEIATTISPSLNLVDTSSVQGSFVAIPNLFKAGVSPLIFVLEAFDGTSVLMDF